MNEELVCEGCWEPITFEAAASKCENLDVWYCGPCQDHGHACECYGGDTTCAPTHEHDEALDDDVWITTGWCIDTEQEHHECNGEACGSIEDHVCDSPCPRKPEVRCIDSVGHDGKCMGPNGPSWEKPEEYQGISPRPLPSNKPRPETEASLEAFA